METTEKPMVSRGHAFVKYIIERIKNDNGFAASLRRADNPSTEYQSWEHLSKWCDLDKPWEVLPFATIAAAVAKVKPSRNGSMGIGQALVACYSDSGNNGRTSDSAKSKLRRLLACETAEEACRILRSLLQLVASRGASVDYGTLLDDLLWFSDKTKQRWAIGFYGRRVDDTVNV